MHIVGLRLNNWMRFLGEHELTLGPGVWAITAEDANDRERSNYLGKSSIPAALRYCFEGRSPRDEARTIDALISRGADEMSVEVELSDGTFISRIKRRGRSADLVIERPGLSSSRGEKAQPLIDEILGISVQDRLTTCWAEQRELAGIVRLTSGPLTEMVESWLGIEQLVAAGDLAEERFRRVSEELASKQREFDTLTESGDPGIIYKLRESINVLTRELDEQEGIAQESRPAHELYLKRKEMSEVLWDREQISKEMIGLKLRIESQGLEDDPRLEHVYREADRAVASQDQTVSRLSRLLQGFDGACPVSQGFQCPARQEIDGRGAANKGALALARHELVTLKRERDEALVPLDAQRVRGRERAPLSGQVEALQRRIETLDAEYRKLVSKGATPLELVDGNYPAPPTILPPPDRSEVWALARELGDRERDLPRFLDLSTDVERLRRELRYHRAALQVLGPEGARRRVVERTVERIWSDASARLELAGVSLSLTPQWGRETGKPADMCSECGCQFPASVKVRECTRCGVARGMKLKHEFSTHLSNYSGAAEDLAGFGLRCAAYAWLRTNRGAAWSVGIFDEPTSQCDQYHRRAVGTHVLRLLGTTFQQVLLISHDRGVFDGIHQRIRVVGRGDWSSVEVVA